MAWYQDYSVPVMIYPEAAADTLSLPAEKQYVTWVLNLEYTDKYFDYISRLIQITKKSGKKSSTP
jgi:hypothetical protein